MTIKDFFSFRQNRFFWANILAMAVVVVGLLFGVLKGLDIYTRHGEAVIVPDVKDTIFPITITGVAGLKIFPIHVFSVINDIRKYVPLILIHIFFTVLQKF